MTGPAVFVGLPFGASARVDVSKVERVGLGEVAQVELYNHPVRSVLEEGGAAYPGVVLGVQIELDISAVVMSSVVLMPALALGTATGVSDYQEGSRKRHYDAEQEHRYPPHALEVTIGAGMTPHLNGLRWCVLCRTSENSLLLRRWTNRVGVIER